MGLAVNSRLQFLQRPFRKHAEGQLKFTCEGDELKALFWPQRKVRLRPRPGFSRGRRAQAISFGGKQALGTRATESEESSFVMPLFYSQRKVRLRPRLDNTAEAGALRRSALGSRGFNFFG